MRFVSFEHQDRVAAGVLLKAGVLPLPPRGADGSDLSSVLSIIRGGAAALADCRRAVDASASAAGALVGLAEVRLLAPIPRPIRNVFCVGRNYLDHVKEGYEARDLATRLPEVPQFFTKATHAVIGPGAEVRLDTELTRRLDYEVELAVIIGRGGRDIRASDALEHVFGYTIANDVTARDLQRRHDQWFKGKSLDTTLPLGPSIVSRDEIADLPSLELTLSVNGEERQRARVAQMIFDVAAIIASLSAGLTLEAGDIISTGTPAGVGFAMNPPHYLQDGDEMVARISTLGELRNRIAAVA